jgi:DNA-binding transcriptional regulator/RsmH inhibitor MraZ
VDSTNERQIDSGAEPPLGVVQASVDDKGRLKLPERFQSYLQACGVKRVFITSLDRRQARIYPMEQWLANQKVFESARQSAGAAGRLAYLAKVYGGESDIDGNGRVLLPPALRQELELDQKQPVWLDVFGGRINVVTKKVFDEVMAAAKANNTDDLKAMEELGLT